jgi:hypothetical protein
MTSEVKDIPEAYIHLIHTKQYYTLQYAVNLGPNLVSFHRVIIKKIFKDFQFFNGS